MQNIFAFDHNWSQPVIEKLAWKTEVYQGESGKEQRRCLRQFPRRNFNYSLFQESAEQSALFKRFVRQHKVSLVTIPIWTDMSVIISNLGQGELFPPVNTLGKDYENQGQVLFWQSPSDWNLYTIQLVSSNQLWLSGFGTAKAHPAGTVMAPVRTGWLAEELAYERPVRDIAVTSQTEFELFGHSSNATRYDTIAPAQYRSVNCFDLRPETTDAPAETIVRGQTLLDGDIGARQLVGTWDRDQQAASFRWLALGRAEIRTLLGWLYYWRGRFKPCWMPSWTEDFRLHENIAAGTQLRVKDWQYATTDNLQESKRDLVIVLRDDTIYRRRLTAAATESGGTELLTVDSALPAISTSQVEQICYLRFVRLALDEIELEWITSQAVSAKLRFVELTTTA